ncbi:MAG: hypothetical protein NXH75_06890, partial [Halobacteriovoraceae bacterium]|nr:hypothetical protein [Halobacteriovoraceae bacterium]
MEENKLTDDDFSEVVLSKVDPERPLPTDIFLKVDNKFIKFRSKNDPIGKDKYELFIAKGVKNIFIPSEEIMEFLSWLNELNEGEETTFV